VSEQLHTTDSSPPLPRRRRRWLLLLFGAMAILLAAWPRSGNIDVRLVGKWEASPDHSSDARSPGWSAVPENQSGDTAFWNERRSRCVFKPLDQPSWITTRFMSFNGLSIT